MKALVARLCISWLRELARFAGRRHSTIFAVLLLLLLLYIITSLFFIYRRIYGESVDTVESIPLSDEDIARVLRLAPPLSRASVIAVPQHLTRYNRTAGVNVSGSGAPVNYGSDICRNSVQGRSLLVDERGYVCSRRTLLPNGCCRVEGNSTVLSDGVTRGHVLPHRHKCVTCDRVTHCCGVFEYCVSCCLRDDQEAVLLKMLQRIPRRQILIIRAVADLFELCLSVCRTSSLSVRQHNMYINNAKIFCFGVNKS